MASLLESATKLAKTIKSTHDKLSAEDEIYRNAVDKVNQIYRSVTENADEGQPDISDKGTFGGRQVEFVQEVYYLPKQLTGDESQPVGLLTQYDLNNYVFYRKGDRLTFKYKEGQSGACKYSAKKNGETEYARTFDWSDQLIQELIDEGACKLI